jgi:hypothetical protein
MDGRVKPVKPGHDKGENHSQRLAEFSAGFPDANSNT